MHENADKYLLNINTGRILKQSVPSLNSKLWLTHINQVQYSTWLYPDL